MAASFFSGAHNFSVGEMNVKNVSGDYIDHSTKNVRNTFRGGNNYYSNYDNSYHDSSSHHHGNNYTTTNYNHGPVNNIRSVNNANFGTNHGSIQQSTFDGPQQNSHVENQYNGSSYNYLTEAPGGNVVNGNFNGTQNNYQGAPDLSGPPYGRGRGPSPPPDGPPRFPPRNDDRPYGPDPGYGYPRPGPAPAPAEFTASDTAVPKQQYRDQQERQEQAGGLPVPSFNPWQNTDQHQAPPNAPHPIDRTNTAPGRPQPNEEWKEHQNHPAAAPPAAFPPPDNQAPAPSQSRSAQAPPASSGLKEKKVASAPKPKKKPSWEGESYLRDELNKNGISYSSDSELSTGGKPRKAAYSDSSDSDGYGAGSGRRRKEEEARKEKEARKERDARKEEPVGGWGDNPLFQEANTSQSLLSVPPRQPLPPYVDPMPLTLTPVPDNLRKSAPSPTPSYKGPSYGQLPLASNPRSGSALNVGSTPLPNPLPEVPLSAKNHKPMPSPPVAFPDEQSTPLVDGASDHEDAPVDLHTLFPDVAEKKKKSKNPMRKLVKVFGPSKKKAVVVG